MAFEFAQIVAKLVEGIGFGGEVVGWGNGLEQLRRASTCHLTSQPEGRSLIQARFFNNLQLGNAKFKKVHRDAGGRLTKLWREKKGAAELDFFSAEAILFCNDSLILCAVLIDARPHLGTDIP